jgi:large subunit ribosomal protein L23
MGFFDRFKSKKESELKGQAPASRSSNVKEALKEKKAVKKAPTKMGVIPAELAQVIVKPLVTEKAAHLASQGQYCFVVSPKSTRIQVRAAVRALYGIQPVEVNIQRVRGKVVRFGRMTGQRRAWKKAIVTLPAGKTIDVYEGV